MENCYRIERLSLDMAFSISTLFFCFTCETLSNTQRMNDNKQKNAYQKLLFNRRKNSNGSQKNEPEKNGYEIFGVRLMCL